MNGFMNFIGHNITAIINICGVALALLFLSNYMKLYMKKISIIDALDRKNVETKINKKTLEVQDTNISEASTPETILRYEKDFNKIVAQYNVYSQLIAVFPLFGILGTVAGLLVQLSAHNEEALNGLFDSLGIAMGSTFWGLIWTIGFKIFVAFASTKTIDETENMLESYEKKLNTSIKLNKITGEEGSTESK